MKTIGKLKSALLCSALLLAFSLPVHAVSSTSVTSGNVNVKVTVPEFIILHYYSSLDLTFDTPNPSGQALDEGENAMNVGWDGSTSGNTSIPLTQTGNPELDGNSTVTVSIPNVWAVRGFAPNGKANVTITSLTSQLTKDGSKSVIDVSALDVTAVSGSSNSNGGIDVPLNGIAKTKASRGGVTMDLDFKNTTQSGEHTGALYTITATAI